MRYPIITLLILSVCQPVFASPKDASVYVSVDLGNGRTAGGTGTVIAAENGRSLILTNAHVVPSARNSIKVTYYWTDGGVYITPVTYLGGSAVTQLDAYTIKVHGPDLALLELCYELPVFAEIAVQQPPIGTPITIFGFGGTASTTTPVTKNGRILGDPGYSDQPAIRHSAHTINGDSGAGLFDQHDELVAVHWGWAAVRLDVVQEFTWSIVKAKRTLFPRLHERLVSKKKQLPNQDPPAKPIRWSDV